MSSYALLNAFSGFEFDLAHHCIGFDPRPEGTHISSGNFRSFWSLDSGWGEVEITPNRVELRLLGGHLDLQTLRLPFLSGRTLSEASIGAQQQAFSWADGAVHLAKVTRIEPDRHLRLMMV